ncbi:DHA2 family multidrug resistance protein-like MFS transporter [Thermocatellispora tengchongensis]|uniref:DHA2 family multidrug resistance protein-like MFS transporter n=1 Tax=Thermocatellispora tengchongensis TaxID=1073253 RepID=A0A840PED4_9ACTN|nr:MFS transporter [Thermocatellispora tengchongensis]MBB5134395.1 DHA2 family multidrug resistance protein-like MFS transporter [Thermocatellispora tengchongensis]
MSTTTLAGTPAQAPARAGRREWVGLAVLALPTLLVSIDVFVMLLALPYLSADLGASATQQLWITDIYGFMLAGFLVTMGGLGDRIGRRRLLLIGAAAFGIASVLAAYSVSAGMLIAARALLGVAGATLAPSTLALIGNMFRDPRQRGLAIGVWMTCFMGGAAIGPVVGGAMLASFWWGSAFLLGVPAMVLLLVLGPVLLPEYRGGEGGLDLTSVALSLAAILPVVYGLKELAKGGWAPVPLAALGVGAAVAAVFVRRQRRLADPLLDLRLFRDGAFSTALGSMMFGTMLMGAMMLFITQQLQLVHGLSPLSAGLWMMPAVATNAISFLCSPLLARRFRPAYLIGGGLALSVTGLLLMTQVDAVSGPVTLVTGFAIVNLGAGPLVTLSMDLVIGSAPPSRAGSAAALNETFAEFGFAFGIAALGSIGTAVYRAHVETALPAGLPESAVQAARDTLIGATAAARDLPGTLAAALLGPARDAYTSGLHTVAGISAALLAVVAVLATVLLRHVRPTGARQEHG